MLRDMSTEKKGNLREFSMEFSPVSRESMSTDEDAVEGDIPDKNPGFCFDIGGMDEKFVVEEEEEEEEEDGDGDGDEEEDEESDEDMDSAAGSDHFDLLELSDSGTEFGQVRDVICGLPFELYDLEGLEGILSVDVWNDVLSEEDRFGLAKYLPDMDREAFMVTLKEIFTGCNVHFGSPLRKLFEILKGGLCEPRVTLYREVLYSFQKRQHYHLVKRHQNVMVKNLCQIRDAWVNCKGYSIEEKLRVLNIMKSQKSLMGEKEDVEADFSSKDELGEALWSKMAKGRKNLPKAVTNSAYKAATTLDYPQKNPYLVSDPLYEKQNLMRILKSGGSKMPLGSSFPYTGHAFDKRSASYASSAHPRQSEGNRLDRVATPRMREQMRGLNEAAEPIHGGSFGMDPSISQTSPTYRAAFPKSRKKHAHFCDDEYENDDFVGFPVSSKGDFHVYGRRELFGQSSATRISSPMLSNVKASFDRAKKRMHTGNIQGFLDEEQMMLARSRARRLQLKENRGDTFDHSNGVETLPIDTQFEGKIRNGREKKRTAKRESHDYDCKYMMGSATKMNCGILPSENKGGYSQEKARAGSRRAMRDEIGVLRGKTITSNHDIAVSDSSEVSDDEDSIPLVGSKLAFPGGFREAPTYDLPKSKKNTTKKGAKESARAFEGIFHTYEDEFDPSSHLQVLPEENYSSIGKKKGKMRGNPSGLGLTKDVNGGCVPKSGDVDVSQLYEKNGFFLREHGDSPQMSPMKSYPDDIKLRQGVSHGDFVADEEEELVKERHPLANDEFFQRKRKGKNIDPHDRLDRSDTTIIGCTSLSKKRKVKDNIALRGDNNEDGLELQQVEEFNYVTKKKRKKLDPNEAASEKDIPKMATGDTTVADVEMEPEIIPKKKTFTLITPTVHTGFSFSIIHLLSSIRIAMTKIPEDSLDVGKFVEDETKKCDATDGAVASQEDADATDSVLAATANVPSLSIQEIVNRVRSNPGDPCILETQEPLQDLVRGVLKIFQSKSAPLGAKGWKSLVVFEKSMKSWSWIGPVSSRPSDLDAVEEVTSPEAWALPHKMMVKLVDAFANWLKNSQETLQQISSLPPPPMALTEFNLDEKERFRDLKVQKSLSTIGSSSDDIRDYFRREEGLRYSIPDRAFSYTAADGKKSIVAPLRRCGGKPTSKARDHFMLKKDRPPHVTILCLVRDAAARLPGSIGTRADVCTLIRDSQFVIEDVSDAQVNQIVSGALDRLHYERDPCVQFDSEIKLWKYLHREREEEDFEDDGTSSTKRWKRPKKEGAEQSDQGAVTVAYEGSEEQTGLELCSILNAEPLHPENEMVGDLLEDDIRHDVEGASINGGTNHENTNHDDRSVLWEGLDYDLTRDNKLLCQENSTNNDFDDETFGKDRGKLLSTGLL